MRNWIGALALIIGGSGVLPAFATNRDVPSTADPIRPLLVGMQIPEADVRDPDGKIVKLKAEGLKRPTVPVFYRGGWCPYCNTRLKELKDVEGALVKAGYQILAVSADKPEQLHKTLEKHSFSYSLLSDNRLAAAKAFGIVFHVDEVFLIGKDGEFKFEYVNPNYKVRLKAEVLLAAAHAFAEAHIK